jgi:hypothetical protein
MVLRLYCSSKHIPDQDEEGRTWPILQLCNKWFNLVMYMLWLLKNNGVDVEIIDTSKLSERARKKVYDTVIPLAAARKYSIRRVFGTKHQSGIRFGVEVPALLVYEENAGQPTDIYPRGWSPNRRRRDIVTVLQYLNGLLRHTFGEEYRQVDRIINYKLIERRAEK